MTAVFTDLDGLVEMVPDGATVALPPQAAGHGCPIALVRRMIQRGVRGLHLAGGPALGFQAALLAGAGCVAGVVGADGPDAMINKDAAGPVVRADVAIFHVGKVDRLGNVWIGAAGALRALAHAAEKTVVTYEECVEEDLPTDEGAVAETIPARAVAALAEAVRGAWPLGLPGYYPPDNDHLKLYSDAASTEQGLQNYLRNHVYQQLAAV